jgi:hypothetical protein
MRRYNYMTDLARLKREARPLLQAARSRRAFERTMNELSHALKCNEILTFCDRHRYCRVSKDRNDLLTKQESYQKQALGFKTDTLFFLEYMSGYLPKHITDDHNRLRQLRIKERRVGTLPHSEESEKQLIERRITVLYENDPETKARARRKLLLSHTKKHVLTDAQQNELERINAIYPGEDPQYPDPYPPDIVAIPEFDFPGLSELERFKPKMRLDLSTDLGLDTSAPILLVCRESDIKKLAEPFRLLGYDDVDFCVDAQEGFNRGLLFRYSLVVPEVNLLGTGPERPLWISRCRKHEQLLLQVNCDYSLRYKSPDIWQDLSVDELAKRLSELKIVTPK